MAVKVDEYIPGVNEKPKLTITSDKFNHQFVIRPTEDGFVFYEIAVTRGKLPLELQGKYSTMKRALEAVTKYEASAKPSKTKQRDIKYEENHA